MKSVTLFYRNTTTRIDAHELYEHIYKAVHEEAELTVEFKKDISWIFAQELMEKLYNSEMGMEKIRALVKFKGFSDLDQYSWNNMTSAKVNAEKSLRYENHFGYGVFGDGW